MMQQRYAHAKQFNRAKRALKTLKTYLGRVMRDIARKIAGDGALRQIFAHPLMLAGRVHTQNKNLRPIRGQPPGTDLRVFSLHAPEVECIGKGKAHKPYEFGVKASVATTLKHSKGGQFIVHARTLPGKPYDGHTLGVIIPEIERLAGAGLERIVADRGYRGHNAPLTHRFKVYISGQKRRVTEHQTRVEAKGRRRAGHRPHESRASHGPQLSRPCDGRRDQRRARCCRLQLPAPPRMAGVFVVRDHPRHRKPKSFPARPIAA